MPTGFVLIDKPSGPTSHDVVAKARRALGTRRIGHAGTLDPMATGVLILGVGRATRLLGAAQHADKTYAATIRLGQSTTTDDAQGDVLTRDGAAGITEDRVLAAMAGLAGPIEQRPSAVSAIKVNGRRAYDRVRAGEQVELGARKVTVAEFALLATRPAEDPDGTAYLDLDVRVRCSSGTYIRALARDLGVDLGCGGHLTALRRSEAAGIGVERCRDLGDFLADPAVLPVAEVIGAWLPIVEVDPESVREFSHGRQVPATGCDELEGRQAAAIGSGSPDVAAIVRVSHGMLSPAIVLTEPIG